MNMKKVIAAVLLLHSGVILSFTLGVRTKSSAPLLYNVIDRDGGDWYTGITAVGSRSFNPHHMASVLTINGKHYFSLDETGPTGSLEVYGDLNPIWLGLTSTGGSGVGSYKSTVTFEPKVKSCGALLHFYKKCDKYFADVRSAVLSCRTQVKIIEEGGGNGASSTIKSFEDAMNQSTWKYGKMGTLQKKNGLDNIQVKLGFFINGDNQFDEKRALALYFVSEIPTGKGTNAEYAFEPRVGHNHFGLGFGFDEYYNDDDNQVVVGLNWRYLFGATEKRSFDLEDKPWSRYIMVRSIPTSVGSAGAQDKGINFLTLDAKVTLGNQVNAYARWSKKWDRISCELGYNLFYRQKEKISDLSDFVSEFGIDNLVSVNGSTIKDAKMNSYMSTVLTSNGKNQDPGVAVTKDDVDMTSAAVGMQCASSFAGRVEYCGDSFHCGIGASIEASHVKHSYASWNAWVNAAVLF